MEGIHKADSNCYLHKAKNKEGYVVGNKHRCPFCCFGLIDGTGLPGLVIYQGNPSISPKKTTPVKAV